MKHKLTRLIPCLTPGMAAVSFLGLLNGLQANVVLIEDDFSSLPVGVELADRTTWWGPSWNGGDLAYSIVSLDGPGGVASITKTTEVFAGRFYGGGLRSGLRDMPDFGGAEVTPADVSVSFWVKGTSTQDRGQIGVSLISMDTSSGSNVETGAAYYLLPIVPADWMEITVTMDQMRAGIPGHGTDGKAFDFSSDKVQAFIWTRNEFEAGWPIQESENHKWSFSLAQFSAVANVGGGGGSTWAGFPVVDGWANAGEFLGLLYVAHAPWIYSMEFGSYIYLPEEAMLTGGAWVFKPHAQTPQ